MVTGFRTGLGGAQGYFGVTPDLTVFGKCIAGGYPAAGGVGGRREVMNTLAAGLQGSAERAYVGGTLSANPMSCAAGYFSILEMERTDAAAKAAGPPATGCAPGSRRSSTATGCRSSPTTTARSCTCRRRA